MNFLDELQYDMEHKNRAVFLDRDGTVVVGVPYLSNVNQVELNTNAAEAIRKFNEIGYLVIIITNQSGVARGYFDEDRLVEINRELENQLLEKGAKIDAIFYCPHLPESEINDGSKPCQCRKPKPKMLLDASEQYTIDLHDSLMVGDTPGDIIAGQRAGCKTALIYKGKDYYDYKRDIDIVKPDFIVKDLLQVVKLLPV